MNDKCMIDYIEQYKVRIQQATPQICCDLTEGSIGKFSATKK